MPVQISRSWYKKKQNKSALQFHYERSEMIMNSLCNVKVISHIVWDNSNSYAFEYVIKNKFKVCVWYVIVSTLSTV